jgi:hypothetical protein
VGADTNIKRIFNTNKENELIFVTNNMITKYETNTKKVTGQEALEEDTEVRSIVYGSDGNIAVVCKNMIMITNEDLEKISTVKELFPIRSAFWESEKILFYTTTNHWKFSFLNGENGVLRTIE